MAFQVAAGDTACQVEVVGCFLQQSLGVEAAAEEEAEVCHPDVLAKVAGSEIR